MTLQVEVQDLRRMINEKCHDLVADSKLASELYQYMIGIEDDDRFKPVDSGMTPFDVLFEISTAYGGKQIFFDQGNGTIYDRYNGEYISLEEAVSRMADRVGDDGGN